MSSKRRKKISPNTHPASDSEVLPAAETGAPVHVTTGAAATGTKKTGACMNCREHKVRCQFTHEGDNACIRCTRGGDTCIVQESRTRARGSSAPPANLPGPASQESHVHNDTGTIARSVCSRKRSGSQVPRSPPSQPSKQQRRSGSQERAAVAQSQSSSGPAHNPSLDPIFEIEDDQDHLDIDSDMPSNSLEHGANNFMDALSAGEFQLEDDFYGEPHEDIHYGLDDDIDASGGSGLEDDSDDTDDEITQYIHATRPSKPAVQRAPVRQKQVKSTRTGKRGSTTEPTISQDPETCSFMIQCAVRRPNGANAPFEIPSDASLGDIHLAVAQRLDRYPGSVSLQYRLDCDKAKDGCTSIQTLDELSMFKTRMRGLIVPQRLPNGKMSTRVPKKVVVYFEDTGTSATSTDSSTGNGKKVGATSRQQVAKPKPAGGNNLLGDSEGANLHKELVQQLQERWRCDTHSKGSESPTYCYRPPGSTTVCYPLTYSQMSTWAIEIAHDNATLDDKPPTVQFQGARPRSRSTAATQPPQASGPSPGMYGYPPAPVIQVMPPSWVPPGFPGSTGALYPMAPSLNHSYPTGLLPGPAVPSPHTTTMSLPPSSLTSMSAEIPVENIPNILDWFSYLERHTQRNTDRVPYASFGPILKGKGFFRISQLTKDLVSPDHLIKWLGIEHGIAVMIFQYAEQDLAAIMAGKQIPMDS